MFKVELVDIGGDGLVTDFKTPVDTLAEAEVIARVKVCNHIGDYNAELIYDDDMIYEVISGGRSVGVVAITTL